MNKKKNKSRVAGKRISPKVLLLTVAATVLLGACGGGKEGQAADAQASDGPNAKALAVPPGWVGRKPAGEVINGILVPPAPNLDTNNATVAGVDVNGNGVRDDVERLIASEFGGNPEKYTLAKSHAIKLQALMLNPGADTKNDYVEAVRCLKLTGREASLITKATVNSIRRENIYANMLAGVTFRIGGC